MNQQDVYHTLCRVGPSTVPELVIVFGDNGPHARNILHQRVSQLRKWGMVREIGMRYDDPRHPAKIWEAVVSDD